MKKVCIVTGANSGIGFDTALKMVKMDYEVILACRNPVSANRAVANIKKRHEGADVLFMHLDLSSKQSIESFAKNFFATRKKLHVLINNAGVFPDWSAKSPTFTDDGFELAFGTNHLGHFYLTLLLLETLKLNSPSRIVMVSSSLHDASLKKKTSKEIPHIDFDNIQLLEPGTYSSFLAYSNSKLANILFANELAKRVEKTGVTVNSLNPGWIPVTNLNRKPCSRCLLVCVFHGMCRCVGLTRTLSQGSDCVVYVATDERLDSVTGRYFDDCREINSSMESQDSEVAQKLWDASVEMLKLEDSPLLTDL